jgi:integrase
MLILQKEDWGFQQYVAPRVKRRAGAYTPYQVGEIHAAVNEVKAMAGLPSELTGMDLRRTAITQMVEAGSDQFEIMQVSGHANPSSVTPYLVNTFTGASNALAKRWEKKNE